MRRSRRRFWKSEDDTDKRAAYDTLYEALVTVTKLVAPFTPYIAEELYQSGRYVYLSTSSAGRAPRRYRGKDTVEWLMRLGFFDLTPDTLPVPAETFVPPHLSGTNGGHTINLHQFARDGVILLGHVRGVEGHRVFFAPDLYENLGKADGFEMFGKQMIDGFIEANGIDAPQPGKVP